MSRTVRKTKFGEVYKDGQLNKVYPYRRYECDCFYCVGRTKEELDKYLKDEAQKEINRAVNGDDFYFGSWYEGMEGQEVLEDYWNRQWELDSISRELYREAA